GFQSLSPFRDDWIVLLAHGMLLVFGGLGFAIVGDALTKRRWVAGAGDFHTDIVAISSDAEPSIFATMVLKRLEVRNVIAKAGSRLHGEILARVGADRVVFPELETGLRLAHSFNVPNVIDYLDVAPSFGIEKIRPPKSFIGKSLGELDLKARMGLTPIALRRGKQVFVNPARDERVDEGDELIIIGQDSNLDQLRG
ncbi:MAG: TrkA family potassium uptake protein, partial [Candidatus Limnocylindria bacterium]